MTSQSYLQLLYPKCSTEDSIPSPPWFMTRCFRDFIPPATAMEVGTGSETNEWLCPVQYPAGALPQPLWRCFTSSISKSWLMPGQTCLQQEQHFHYSISWIRGTSCQFAKLQLFLVHRSLWLLYITWKVNIGKLFVKWFIHTFYYFICPLCQ